MSTVLRPTRAVFRVSGPEAERLLRDVLTGQVAAETGHARWWALLSPQGKIQAEGLLGWAEQAFWLDLDQSVAAEFARRMRLYKLRAKLEIEDVSERFAVGFAAEAPDGSIVHADPRGGGIGFRVIAEKSVASDWPTDPAPFHRARIAAGIAELGADFAPDSTFPHDIAMDLLGGIDFQKGCYIGQEVVSRMKHRGTARRRPVLIWAGKAEIGMPVLSEGREAGTLGLVVDGQAIAILRLDRITDPSRVTVNGLPVRLALPAWAGYAFGDASGVEQAAP